MESSNKLPHDLKAKIQFLGFLSTTEAWAQVAWEKNPQLLDFYRINRLSWIAWKLEEYDRYEDVRNGWAEVGRPVSFFNGKDFEYRTVVAYSRNELKKKLLAAVRTFVPDPDIKGSPAMDNFFSRCGNRWMLGNQGGKLPTCWQEFFDYCFNPNYDGSLSWDGYEDK